MDRIDTQRRMYITGSVTRDLSRMTSNPLHEIVMDLAQEQMNPAFLRLSDPIDEAATDVPALPFVDWLSGQAAWSEEFFCNLQSVSQTASGESLLTTWLSAEQFWGLLQDGRGVPAIDDITQRTAQWRGLALDEVFFDFHERSDRVAEAMVGVSTEPMAALSPGEVVDAAAGPRL